MAQSAVTLMAAFALAGCVPAAMAEQSGAGAGGADQPPVTSFPGAKEEAGEAACRAALSQATGSADVVVLSSQLTHVGRQVTLAVGKQRWSCIAAEDGSAFDVIRIDG